jgi:mannose-1-phosphate guanylyltransferase
MAGGKGTRLWPLSTPERPKPFLPLLDRDTLIQRCVARLSPLIEPVDVYVVAERRHLGLAREQLPRIPEANLLGEPVGRNTAAAVAFAAEAIDRPDDEAMLVLPADADIVDEERLRRALAAAAQAAAGRRLVTLGIAPDGPETGYGYVLARPPAATVAGLEVLDVERFVEKPDAAAAAALIATGLASWNAGIFAWARGTIRERLRRHAPEIAEPVAAACAAAAAGDGEALTRAYASLRATSIDYAVLEPASLEGAVSVVPADVGWSDLGSWAALRDAWQRRADAASGTPGTGNRRDLGSSGSLVLAGDRLVVTVGLHDTIVVDTPEALLICSAERSQDVKRVAEELVKGERS